MYNTGLRREEGLSLKPSDIEFDMDIVHIPKAEDEEARDVPLTIVAKKVLMSLGNNLFDELKPSYVRHKFKLICDKAGLDGFKLHSLRHTFATRLISAGVDVLAVSKILGHSDIFTTMIYAKVRFETMKSAVDLFKNDKEMVRSWLNDGKKDAEDKKSFHEIS